MARRLATCPEISGYSSRIYTRLHDSVTGASGWASFDSALARPLKTEPRAYFGHLFLGAQQKQSLKP